MDFSGLIDLFNIIIVGTTFILFSLAVHYVFFIENKDKTDNLNITGSLFILRNKTINEYKNFINKILTPLENKIIIFSSTLLILILGFLYQDFVNRAFDNEEPLLKAFNSFFDDIKIKSNVLTHKGIIKKISGDDLSNLKVELTGIGKDLFRNEELLKDVLSTFKNRKYITYENGKIKFDRKESKSDDEVLKAKDEVRRFIKLIYYRVKNWGHKNQSIKNELISVRNRSEFSETILFISTIFIFLTIFIFIIKGIFILLPWHKYFYSTVLGLLSFIYLLSLVVMINFSIILFFLTFTISLHLLLTYLKVNFKKTNKKFSQIFKETMHLLFIFFIINRVFALSHYNVTINYNNLVFGHYISHVDNLKFFASLNKNENKKNPLIDNKINKSLGFSGIAKINDYKYITVHDSKKPFEPRFSFINIKKNKIEIQAQKQAISWQQKEPEDLESICKLPNRKNEFLVFQSGYSHKKTGAFFHIRVVDNKIKVVNLYKLFENKRMMFNMEGTACKALDNDKNNILIIASHRGGKKLKAGLFFGILNLKKKTIDWDTYKDIFIKIDIENWNGRNISDLYIDKNSDLWGVATKDFGNNGPFKSAIYKIGKVKFKNFKEKNTNNFCFNIGKNYSSCKKDKENNDSIKITLENSGLINGLKVEAISESPVFIENSNFIFATDDENFGGILRYINTTKEVQ